MSFVICKVGWLVGFTITYYILHNLVLICCFQVVINVGEDIRDRNWGIGDHIIWCDGKDLSSKLQFERWTQSKVILRKSKGMNVFVEQESFGSQWVVSSLNINLLIISFKRSLARNKKKETKYKKRINRNVSAKKLRPRLKKTWFGSGEPVYKQICVAVTVYSWCCYYYCTLVMNIVIKISYGWLFGILVIVGTIRVYA